LHLAADEPGEMMGRNANFSGKGTAENVFNVTAMSQKDFDDWVKEVHETAEPLTEDEFDKLIEPGHLGQMTFTGTHLDFSPAPEHDHETSDVDSEESHEGHTEDMQMEEEHSEHSNSNH
jgi:cytochrome aa3-600 menaquinol oxidase subunit 2